MLSGYLTMLSASDKRRNGKNSIQAVEFSLMLQITQEVA